MLSDDQTFANDDRWFRKQHERRFQTRCKSFCANTRKIAHISGGNVYGI